MKSLRRHLGKNSIRALSDLRCPKLELYASILVQGHPGPRDLQRYRPYSRLVTEKGHAHAATDVSGLSGVFFSFFFPADIFRSFFQTLENTVAVCGDGFQIGVLVIAPDQVLPPEFQRIHMDLRRDIVHKTFNGKGGLGDSVCAHGPAYRSVGIDRIGLAPDIRTGVLQSPGSETVGRNGVPVGSVGSLIGICLHILCQETPLFVHSGCKVVLDGVSRPGIAESFLSGKLKLHRTAAHLHGEKSVQGFVKHVLLVAESAADVGFDHAYSAPGDPQRLSDHPADNMRDLGGCDHHNPVFLHVGKRDGILQMAVLYHGCLVASLHHRIRLFQALVHISDKKVRSVQHIILLVKMNGRMAPVHGFPGMDLHRIFFILHFDQLQGADRRSLVLRHNRRNIVAVIADAAGKDIPVRHILMGRFYRPGMSRRGIAVVGNILKGHNLHHSLQRLRFAGVNGFHDPVADRGMINFSHKTSGRNHIIGEFGPSGDFFVSVYSRHAFSDHLSHLLPTNKKPDKSTGNLFFLQDFIRLLSCVIPIPPSFRDPLYFFFSYGVFSRGRLVLKSPSSL